MTNLVNWGEAYFNKDSKFFDDCSESTSASTIVLYDYTIANTTTSAPIVGTDSLNGPGCWAFANYTNWAPYYGGLLKMGLEKAGFFQGNLTNEGQKATTQGHYVLIG